MSRWVISEVWVRAKFQGFTGFWAFGSKDQTTKLTFFRYLPRRAFSPYNFMALCWTGLPILSLPQFSQSISVDINVSQWILILHLKKAFSGGKLRTDVGFLVKGVCTPSTAKKNTTARARMIRPPNCGGWKKDFCPAKIIWSNCEKKGWASKNRQAIPLQGKTWNLFEKSGRFLDGKSQIFLRTFWVQYIFVFYFTTRNREFCLDMVCSPFTSLSAIIVSRSLPPGLAASAGLVAWMQRMTPRRLMDTWRLAAVDPPPPPDSHILGVSDFFAQQSGMDWFWGQWETQQANQNEWCNWYFFLHLVLHFLPR